MKSPERRVFLMSGFDTEKMNSKASTRGLEAAQTHVQKQSMNFSDF